MLEMDMSKFYSRMLLSESRNTNFAPFGLKTHSRTVGAGRIDTFLITSSVFCEG